MGPLQAERRRGRWIIASGSAVRCSAVARSAVRGQGGGVGRLGGAGGKVEDSSQVSDEGGVGVARVVVWAVPVGAHRCSLVRSRKVVRALWRLLRTASEVILKGIGDLGGGGAVVGPGHDLTLPRWEVVEQSQHSVSVLELVHCGVGSKQRGASREVELLSRVFADGGQLAGVETGGDQSAPGVWAVQCRPMAESLRERFLGAVCGVRMGLPASAETPPGEASSRGRRR